MFQHNNLSLASITSDEIRWLTAEAKILQEHCATPVDNPAPSSPIKIAPTFSESSSRSTTDSLSATFPRSKGAPRRGHHHHHYQRSTKSSSAKVVAPSANHRACRASGSKRPLQPQLNCDVVSRFHVTFNAGPINECQLICGSSIIKTPATPILTTPSIDSPQSAAELASSVPGPSSASAGAHLQTPPRPVKRTHSYSSTHNGSPGQEWIYRQPKPPSSSVSAIRYAHRTESGSSSVTSSPASTRHSSRCATPTSASTYRPDMTDYFAGASTRLGNSTSSLQNSAAVTPDGNADGNSVGSIGSIGVLVPSSFGFSSSESSSLPSSAGKGNSNTSTFWTNLLRTRSGSTSNSSSAANLYSSSKTTKPSKLSSVAAGTGSLKGKQNEFPTDAAIPSLWSGANVDGGNGGSPVKRRGKDKGRRSIRELGITPLLPLPDPPNKAPSKSSLPRYSSPLKKRALHTRSASMSSSTSTSTSASAPPLSASVSSMSSSPPTTPTAPLPFQHVPNSGSVGKAKKFQPHHRCIIEDVEDDELGNLGMDAKRRKSPSPTKSILSSRTPYSSEYPPNSDSSSSKFDSGVSLGLDKEPEKATTQRKNSACTTGSNKSVKFADTPTVHYASGGYSYESWDGMTGAGPFDLDMGIDVDDMDLGSKEDENEQQYKYVHPYACPHPYAAQSNYSSPADEHETEDAERDNIVGTHLRNFDPHTKAPVRTAAYLREQELVRAEACTTPTPGGEKGKDSISAPGTGSLRRLVSLQRKPSSSSSSMKISLSRSPSTLPAKPAISRPAISGPYVLGSTTHSLGRAPNSNTPASIPPLPSSAPAAGHGLDLRGAGLRSAPSLESFRSGKSGGTKSVMSLKSLPESVKSSVSLRAKEVKDWFKARTTVQGVNAM